MSELDEMCGTHVDDLFFCATQPTREKFWTKITKLVERMKRGETLNPRIRANLLRIRVPKCTMVTAEDSQ